MRYTYQTHKSGYDFSKENTFDDQISKGSSIRNFMWLKPK
jgi:hypothetical protein